MQQMSTPSAIVGLWIVFYSFWLISATTVKRAARATPLRRSLGLRMLLIIAAIAIIRSRAIRSYLAVRPSSPALVALGVLLCVAGLAFAVWARLHLGRNWGTPMSLREGHELVTTGPYRFVRHPIYTGILAALLGSGLAAGPVWFVFFVVVCPFFVFSAWTEERIMAQQFPDAYSEYKKRTGALIPHVR